MKKFLVLGLVLVLGFWGIANASITSNASPIIVKTTSAYQSITFPTTTTSLYIRNMDSSAYLYVDLKSSSNTGDLHKCTIIPPSDSLELYEFFTDGISVLRSDGTYGTARMASPAEVLAIY